MEKSKVTKRALFSSVIALILCFAMLIGATFAWFTDTATSGVNTITAGNLDIEVSYKDGDTWKSIQDVGSLFSSNLWEPGHTEVVYLKVKNAGTLGLNYKVLVTPVSENGGVNVNNQSFKLSDYLVFGTTAPGAEKTYTREEARAAVATNGMGLNVNNLTKSNTMMGKNVDGYADQYMALVVYMPETVGNEANYKTGTTAPSIELGIKVVATQLAAESDSLGNDYDNGAVTDSFYTVGAYYDYYPQVMASEEVTVNSDNTVAQETTIKATGKLNSTDTTDTTLAKVTVPVGAKLVADTTELTVKVVPKEAEAATNTGLVAAGETAANGRETANFDIKVEGIDPTNEESINVEVFVGKGLSNVKVYHNGTLITGSDYNPTTGIVKFATTGFSDFTAAYDVAAAAIGAQTYGSLENAVKAANDGDTVKLLKDAAGNGVVIPSGSNLTVDFNTFTYDIDGTTVGSPGTETNGFQLLKDSTITFKNGKITSNKAALLIQNYSNLTLDNMTVSAGAQCSYVVSNNNGNVVIKDTTINAPADKVAFDVCRYDSYTGPSVTVQGKSVINGKVEISSSGAKEGAVHELNVTGGTFNGEIYMAGSNPNFVGNITGGTFSSNPSKYLATGYSVIADGDRYKVIEGTLVANAEEMTAALNNGANLILLNSAEGLEAFANEVNGNGNGFSGKTIKLVANIDLESEDWTPIGSNGSIASYPNKAFAGTFDGQNYTISNLKVDVDGEYAAAGLFGAASRATIKNVVIDGADIHSTHYAGGILGYETECTVISNCHVKNSTIVSAAENSKGEWDNGDKVGGIVGYMNVADLSDCTVSNTSIQGYRDLGGIAGYIGGGTVSKCSITNVTITVDNTHNYKNYTGTQNDANDIIGENHGTMTDCTGTATFNKL